MKRENSYIKDLQKTINDTNLNIDNNCLALVNIDKPSRDKSKDSNNQRNRNLVKKNVTQINNDSEKNKHIFILEDKEDTRLLENKRESNKNDKIINGKVSFVFNDSIRKNSIKDNSIIRKSRRLSSNKTNIFPGLNEYIDYKNFFYLTFEAIKHNTDKVHIFREIDVDKLYKYSIIHSIPFYKVKKNYLLFNF